MKINVIKTDYEIELKNEDLEIEIIGADDWEVTAKFVERQRSNQMVFEGMEEQPVFSMELSAKPPQHRSELIDSKDAGLFKKEVAEIQTLFEYLEANKQNIFDELGFEGKLA